MKKEGNCKFYSSGGSFRKFYRDTSSPITFKFEISPLKKADLMELLRANSRRYFLMEKQNLRKSNKNKGWKIIFR
jgi:hypothetical protein